MSRPSIYSRPDKPLTIPVRERRDRPTLSPIETPAPVAVDAATECHVTPGDVAARMVGYLGRQGDFLTLEPSAGTGQLAQALLNAGHSPCELVLVEKHIRLASGLYRFGAAVNNRCFLEWAAEVKGRVSFPRVIMNPPFRQVRQHVKAAVELLGSGGHCEPATLVALVPVTYRNDDAETVEILPEDTFTTARVRTKIIRVVRGAKP